MLPHFLERWHYKSPNFVTGEPTNSYETSFRHVADLGIRFGPVRVGFEGTFREVKAPERLVLTFGFDGMPGHEVVNTMALEDLGDGRTRLVATMVFESKKERDGMLDSGMEKGMEESYTALDKVLAVH